MPPRFTQDLPSPPRRQPVPAAPPTPTPVSQPAAFSVPPTPPKTRPVAPIPEPPVFGSSRTTRSRAPAQPVAMPSIPGAPPVYGAPSAYTRAPSGTVVPASGLQFPVPQRVLRPRKRPVVPPDSKLKSFWAHLNKKLVIAIASGLLLLGGGSAAYYWFGPPSAPRNVFDGALSNMMMLKSYQQDFTISRKIGNAQIKAHYVSNIDTSDITKPKATGTMEVSQTVDGVISNRSGEFVLFGSDEQYLKLKDFSDDTISGTDKGVDKQSENLLAAVKDKWLVTDESKSDLPLSTLILLNPLQLAQMDSINGLLLLGNIDAAKRQQLLDFNNNQHVYTIATAKTQSFQGYNVYRYDVNLLKTKLQEYNQLLNKQTVTSTTLTSFDAIVLYVDTVSRLPVRMEAQQDDLTIVVDYNNFNKPVAITKPSGAQKLEDAVPGGTANGEKGSLELQGSSQ